jgi:hypothetical protein
VTEDAKPEPEPDDASPALAPTGDLTFDALWNRTIAAWDDDRPHAALVEYAIRTERLPELAGRYRKLAEDPEKAERARKRLDGVVLAATNLLYATKMPARTKTPWQWTVTLAAIAVFVLAWLAYKILAMGR